MVNLVLTNTILKIGSIIYIITLFLIKDIKCIGELLPGIWIHTQKVSFNYDFETDSLQKIPKLIIDLF